MFEGTDEQLRGDASTVQVNLYPYLPMTNTLSSIHPIDLWLLPTKMNVKDTSPHSCADKSCETSPVSVSLTPQPGRTGHGDHSEST